MRAVIQRVSRADVKISGSLEGEIGTGLLVLLGVAEGDTLEDADWLATKIVRLRVFPDTAGLMNRSVLDVAGGILVISQFTLIASTRKGTRPSFNAAAKPEGARPLYDAFLTQVEGLLGRRPARGTFGAEMQVTLVNDGPVTLVIDSRSRE